MRGEDRTSGALFSYVDMEARIPAKHPLRAMRRLTNAALAELEQRAAAGFPPSRRLVYLGVISRDRELALSTARRYAALLADIPGTELLGPAPYPIARLNREWRYRLAIATLKPALVRAAIRERIVPVAHAETKSRIAINVDP